MSLQDVLNEINHRARQVKGDEYPANEQAEVQREFILIRGLLNELLEDTDLDEARKQAEFSNRLLQLITTKETHVTHQFVLATVDSACKQSEVSITLKPKLK